MSGSALVITEGEAQVTDVGVGIVGTGEVNLEHDTITSGKATV